MNTTFVLIGPHSAGKTTIGHAISKRLDCRYDHEIGRVLREKYLKVNSKYHAMIEQDDFDIEVFRQEYLRDLRSNCNRIVETWHPGNIAYSYLRSPRTTDYLMAKVKKHLTEYNGEVVIQPITVNNKILLKRMTETAPCKKDLASFFTSVGDTSIKLSYNFKLKILDAIDTSYLSIIDSINQVYNRAQMYFSEQNIVNVN
jgi:adenylate kinase family enzyme